VCKNKIKKYLFNLIIDKFVAQDLQDRFAVSREISIVIHYQGGGWLEIMHAEPAGGDVRVEDVRSNLGLDIS
jgi:hypothetical protein